MGRSGRAAPNGVRRVGRVWYSDDLQVLVKWGRRTGEAVCVLAGTSPVGGRSGDYHEETAAHRKGGVESHLPLMEPEPYFPG